MKRRTVLGLAAIGAGTLLTGASAVALGHAHGDGMMRRVAAAAIDEALDAAQVNPEQRRTIYAARDRVFGAIEDHRRTRATRLDEIVTAFEQDEFGPERVLALRQRIEAEHGKIADTVGQALVEVHDLLTPGQRKLLADYVRAHGPRAH